MDPITAMTIVLTVAALPAFALAARTIGGGGWGLEDLFRPPSELGWPRGVQEEEPIRYRFEHRRPVPPRSTPSTQREVSRASARRPGKPASFHLG